MPHYNSIENLEKKSAIEIWNPDTYDTANGVLYCDAKELIMEILADTTKKTDIIFEIGCGSGNITKLVSNNLYHEKIVACDISEEMIEHASNTYKNDNKIEYLVQDFGVEWNNLDERIRQLEGTVDLVFSNYAMHLIENKVNAMNNITRLLKKGGLCCVNIPSISFYNESEEETAFLEREEHVTWLPLQRQLKLFTNLFLDAGFIISKSQFEVRTWKFPSFDEFEKLYIPVSKACANHILKPNTPERKRQELMLKYEQLFLNFKRRKALDDINDKNRDGSVTAYIQRFRFISKKVTNSNTYIVN